MANFAVVDDTLSISDHTGIFDNPIKFSNPSTAKAEKVIAPIHQINRLTELVYQL
jgi:hypothetical protein